MGTTTHIPGAVLAPAQQLVAPLPTAAKSGSRAGTADVWWAPAREELLCAADQGQDHQQHHGTNHAGYKTCGLPLLEDAQCLCAIRAHKGAANTHQGGEDDAHAVIAGLQEARDKSHNEADEDSPDDVHGVLCHKGDW